VPVAEVEEGNVRWQRWTVEMVRLVLNALRERARTESVHDELAKVALMIRSSFAKTDPVRSKLKEEGQQVQNEARELAAAREVENELARQRRIELATARRKRLAATRRESASALATSRPPSVVGVGALSSVDLTSDPTSAQVLRGVLANLESKAGNSSVRVLSRLLRVRALIREVLDEEERAELETIASRVEALANNAIAKTGAASGYGAAACN
jgi:hypothetical protein